MSRQPPRTCQYKGVPKEQFPTEEAANAHPHRGQQRPYKCPNCPYWHLTSRDPIPLDRRLKKLFRKPRQGHNKRQKGAWS